MRIEILQVHVGTPQALGPRELDLVSSIAKHLLAPGPVRVTTLNLDGDDQSDRTVHGGADKAVYAYPSEHLRQWEADLGQSGLTGAAIAPFGENLSTRGVTEADVFIGDEWTWGGVRLQIAQPRWPCQKLAVHRSPRAGSIMRSTGRTGWYLRVLTPGVATVGEPAQLDVRHPDAVTVLDAHLAMADRHLDDRDRAERVAALGDVLAAEWRLPLIERLHDR
jgi:MOSC domain-containing protein YiiM